MPQPILPTNQQTVTLTRGVIWTLAANANREGLSLQTFGTTEPIWIGLGQDPAFEAGFVLRNPVGFHQVNKGDPVSEYGYVGDIRFLYTGPEPEVKMRVVEWTK